MDVYTFNPPILGGIKKRVLEVNDTTIIFGQKIVRFEDIESLTSYVSETTIGNQRVGQRKLSFTFVFWLVNGEEIKIEFDDATQYMSTEEGTKIYRYVLDVVWKQIGKSHYFSVMKELNEGRVVAIEKNIELDKNGLTLTKKGLFVKRQKRYTWNDLVLRKPFGYFILIEDKARKKLIKRFDSSKKEGIIYREVMNNCIKNSC